MAILSQTAALRTITDIKKLLSVYEAATIHDETTKSDRAHGEIRTKLGQVADVIDVNFPKAPTFAITLAHCGETKGDCDSVSDLVSRVQGALEAAEEMLNKV